MASNQPLLDLLTAPRVERVYTDKDTGADQNISVFQAEGNSIPGGAYMVGQVLLLRTQTLFLHHLWFL